MKWILLIRGESFRTWWQNSRIIWQQSAFQQQIEAIHTHISCIKHIINLNINLDIFIDTISTPFDSYIKDLYGWFTKKIIFHKTSENTQMMSIKRALIPIQKLDLEDYDFVMILRIDLYLKEEFTKKINFQTNKLLYPFVCWYKDRKFKWYPRPSDVFYFIPRRYIKVLDYFIIPWMYTWHESIFFWSKIFEKLEYDFMVNTYHDSDSSKDWNPLYYIINRDVNNKMSSSLKLIFPDDF